MKPPCRRIIPEQKIWSPPKLVLSSNQSDQVDPTVPTRRPYLRFRIAQTWALATSAETLRRVGEVSISGNDGTDSRAHPTGDCGPRKAFLIPEPHHLAAVENVSGTPHVLPFRPCPRLTGLDGFRFLRVLHLSAYHAWMAQSSLPMVELIGPICDFIGITVTPRSASS